MLDIDWNIEFKNNVSKRFKLALLAECEIIKSVDNLTERATITLPETVMNQPLNFGNKIGRGTQVWIELGYNKNIKYNKDIKREFTGYIREITTHDGSLKIECEGALFLFRRGIKDKFFKEVGLKEIARYVANQVNEGYRVVCDYTIVYKKFTIHQATGYDVLKKLKEQSRANIFFDTQNKELHIHRPYTHKTGEVIYSLQKNVESSQLEYELALDKKTEVTVESTDDKGNVQKYKTGTTGGDSITLKAGTMDKTSIKKLAEETLKEHQTPRYKGTFDTWLIPYVAPGYSAIIKDEDYPKKTGRYYIKSVTTGISPSGGKRTVTPGRKL